MKESTAPVARAWHLALRGEGPRRRRALTFVEIMVAVIIMVAAFFPLFSMMRSGVRRAKFQKIRAFGTTLVQNTIERLRGMSIHYLESKGGTEWYTRAETRWSSVEGGPHLSPESLGQMLTVDPVFAPVAGKEGVPDDPEMQDLIKRWNDRAGLFRFGPHFISSEWDAKLASMNMAILAVSCRWDGEDFVRMETLDALQSRLESGELRGGKAMTMFAIIGEGLFHPPPALGPGTPGG